MNSRHYATSSRVAPEILGVPMAKTSVIIYKLYVNSKLLLVNPMISFKYSIYSIKYMDGDVQRQAMLISPNKDILENDMVKLYNIGYQLFYGYNR